MSTQGDVIHLLRDPAVVLTALTLATVLVVLGLLLGAVRRRTETALAPAPSPPPSSRLLDASRELMETITDLKADNRELAQVLTILLSYAKELTRHREKREIAPLMSRVINDIFEPQHIFIFDVDRAGEQLILSHREGPGTTPKRGARVAFGEGPVGQVAVNQVSMNDDDISTQARFHSRTAPSLGPDFQNPDLCAPMVSEGETLGVIALYGLGRQRQKNDRRRNEKQIMKFIADLGATSLRMMLLLKDRERQANQDGLTGLYNKRYFLSLLNERISRAEETNAVFSLLVLDIDHFKNYNDANGHLAGDDALRLTGSLLKEHLRADDTPARFGGEEFVVLFPDLTPTRALEAGEKIRRLIETCEYPHEELQPLGQLTVSGGVASYPLDGTNDRELFAAADEALYRAKRGGRNRVLCHEQAYFSAADDSPTAEQSEELESISPRPQD